MLRYTYEPERRKKSDLPGESFISLSTVLCDTVIPAAVSSRQLYTNEVFEVNLVTDGCGICRVFSESIPCKKGDVFIIPPNIPHNCFAGGETETVSISRLLFDTDDWFSGEIADIGTPRFCYGIFAGSPVIAYATLNAKTYGTVISVFDSITQELTDKQKEWKDAVRFNLSLLFITIARYIGKADQTETGFVKEWYYAGFAQQIVMESFSDAGLKLENLANMMYISKSHLSRLFQQYTGDTFSSYLRNIRLNHACKLLRETDMNLEQILASCGLHDIRAFYRNFQNYTGTTPTQYRNEKKVIRPKGEKTVEILTELSENMQNGKAKAVTELVQRALDEGYTPEEILNDGLMAGMSVIGEKFKKNDIYIPQVLVAARAMNMGAQVLKPYLSSDAVVTKGKVCLGTVKGDLHDIGKNLVKMMLESKGLEVVDLGTDVAPESFINTAIDENCQVICCSALLTTTMSVMEDVVKAAETAGIRNKVKIMIGGAPVTEEFCKKIGADAYTPDAASAAEAALLFCNEK